MVERCAAKPVAQDVMMLVACLRSHCQKTTNRTSRSLRSPVRPRASEESEQGSERERNRGMDRGMRVIRSFDIDSIFLES